MAKGARCVFEGKLSVPTCTGEPTYRMAFNGGRWMRVCNQCARETASMAILEGKIVSLIPESRWDQMEIPPPKPVAIH